MDKGILNQLKEIGIDHSDVVEILTERMFPLEGALQGFVVQIETGEYFTPSNDFDLNLSEAEIFSSFVEAKVKVDEISNIFMADICLLIKDDSRVDTVLVYCSDVE